MGSLKIKTVDPNTTEEQKTVTQGMFSPFFNSRICKHFIKVPVMYPQRWTAASLAV
jgi:hypothetical protein